MKQLFEIIHESAEILVINKPAGLVCHPTKTDEYSSLISRVRLHLGGEARPHLINRLDRETSGLVIVGKSDDAARELRGLWESREVHKEYLAIVRGEVHENQGIVDAPLGRDDRSRVAIKDCVRPDGLPSKTEFSVQHRFTRNNLSPGSDGSADDLQPFTVLRVRPLTGRKHQIRIHLAHRGHPIVGDKLYGGDEDTYLALVENRLTAEQKQRLLLPYQALHAAAVRYHWRGQPVEFRCEAEPWFNAFMATGKEGAAGPGFLPEHSWPVG